LKIINEALGAYLKLVYNFVFEKNNFLSILRIKICDKPETPVVKTSAVCTLAETIAGGTPIVSNSVEQLTPYAIPNAPSIICAVNPAKTNNTNSLSIENVSNGFGDV